MVTDLGFLDIFLCQKMFDPDVSICRYNSFNICENTCNLKDKKLQYNIAQLSFLTSCCAINTPH